MRQNAETRPWTPITPPRTTPALQLESLLYAVDDFWVTISTSPVHDMTLIATGHISHDPNDLLLRQVTSWDAYGGEENLPWRVRVLPRPMYRKHHGR